MNHYIILYLGGEHPATPEEGQQHFAKYQQWLQSLGDATVNPMVPHKETRCIAADGSVSEGSSASLSGHTIVQAESIETAVELAKGCPFLDINGTLEVAELAQMPAKTS